MRDIFFLTSGQLRAPSFVIGPDRRLANYKTTLMSLTVAVAIRDSGDVVLVDVGWSEEVCLDPVGTLGRLRAASVGIDVRPGESVASQLAALGIPKSAVTTVIATHLHFDHVEGIADFPNAELVTTEEELEAYRTGGVRSGYRTEDLARTSRMRVVPVDGRPSYGFPGSHDLFGDGEIVLLDARGHTKGLVAVGLRSRERNYVHVGDAVYQSWEYGLSPRGPCALATQTAWSRRKLERTYEHIRACEADRRKPLIVPSHDLGVFEGLPHRPRAAVPPLG